MARVPHDPDDETGRLLELQEQVDQLKEAVSSHAVVDQAIGMIVALGRMTPDQGWEVLKQVSQHTNTKLRNVAEMILVWGGAPGSCPRPSGPSWRRPWSITVPHRSRGAPPEG
ncbi:hypothetical protein GCM10020256_72370 [Streptomyces thermocoprophilus]